MERREFVKAAVAVAGTLGLSRIASAETKAGIAIDKLTGHGNPSDLEILNQALMSEYQAVHAYDIALQTGHLKGEARELAKMFQASHQGHVALVSEAIIK